MNIEYEATFTGIDKNKIRQKLKKIKAKLVRPEFMQRRVVFNPPSGHEIKGGWLRIRDEGNKTTMSLKIIDGSGIEDQKEVELEIDNFAQAELLLTSIGCEKKAYQESKRELWKFSGVDITIDEWPFLEPFIEIEGPSEAAVKEIAEKLELNYAEAIFDSVDGQYAKKYNITKDRINNKTPLITFKDNNPFL